MQVVAIEKSGLRKERVCAFDVPEDEEVLPRDERLVENQHGIILVETARERMIECTASVLLVGRPAQQTRSRRIHWGDEDKRKILRLTRFQVDRAVLGDKRRVRQR